MGRSVYVVTLAAGLVLAGAGFSLIHKAGAGAPPAAGGPPQAMPVQAALVQETEAQVWSEYSGRLAAVDTVALRPQVSGAIDKIKFEDGQMVKKGDVLFVIDPRRYEAAAAQAQAELATAKSQYEFSEKDIRRAEDLVKTGAISQRLLDERRNSFLAAKNSIDSAAAKLRQAKLDLDYAYVKAPISGRAGRAEITEGNLVEAGPNAPVLTTIVASDEIYADFDVDEQTYLGHVHGNARGLEAERTVPVKLSIGDKTYSGTIHSFDNKIDTATGTIRARALFKNEDGALLPGMSVTVRLGSPGQDKKILITERAIGTDQDRRFVYVVGEGNKIVYREVKLGASMDGQRVVLDGLKGGEVVVTEGIIRLRPDMVVDPQTGGEPAPEPPPAPAEDAELLKKVETDKEQ